jgi:predicted secreted hydrolase
MGAPFDTPPREGGYSGRAVLNLIRKALFRSSRVGPVFSGTISRDIGQAQGEGDWKRYPYVPDWGDPRQFSFPAVDGYQPALGMSTYFVDGFLRGGSSGRLYAFMVIFTDMRVVRGMFRAAFYTFALYDCDAHRYGTYTDFDLPRPSRLWRRHKIEATPGHLALRYAAAAGMSRWEAQRDADGTLRAFAWTLELHGVDHHGERMALALDVDATRPPAPLGGRELRGEMMFLGAERTYSYFQSGLQMRGHLEWGGHAEDVEGDTGWIDRQWAVDDFTVHQDWRSTRYRNEWRVMQFDNGWDMSCFHQYHRHQRNAVVPWSGISAQGPGPAFELRATHRIELITPEFIRSPGIVRSPMMITDGPRYFPHRYRLRAPEWEMDVQAEPLVDAPAHRLPIEYWTGPVRIRGVLFGQQVNGVGFDERSCPRVRGFEVAEALRLTAEHLPDVDDDARRLLAYRAWEVEALCLRGDRRTAAAHLRAHVHPLLDRLPDSARARVGTLAADLLSILDGKFPRGR